ncbi:GNAT family N-acetyltransferase [Clostridium hydrogeniformans]|uniref:GNAT family N-acetyltransferase n=1 Tax=Clostridium hydrogeniformans TaxID=349933 RepID=UPI0004853701|nr:GNAT family N-acetyltransferase [Clostridium hydrogeniformans]
MAIKSNIQPNIIEIDDSLRLIKPNHDQWKVAISWYENPKVLYYSEGLVDKVYDMKIIESMYRYLSNNGELYFIEVKEDKQWSTIGDVTLSEENLPIVLGYEKYFGQGIGKKVMKVLIERAKTIGIKKLVVPKVYSYNNRSQNLFESLGFKLIKESKSEKSYELILA